MRRMCYLTIKEMAKMTENAFIVTQRLVLVDIVTSLGVVGYLCKHSTGCPKVTEPQTLIKNINQK